VRPEAWHIGPPGVGLAARLAKAAYLGSNYEYTFKTELGAIFVVSPDLTHVLQPGDDVGLSLADHGVSWWPTRVERPCWGVAGWRQRDGGNAGVAGVRTTLAASKPAACAKASAAWMRASSSLGARDSNQRYLRSGVPTSETW
jgi:hypothetical protein